MSRYSVRAMRLAFICAMASAVLTACGGGGGGDHTPPPVVVLPTPLPATLTLATPSAGTQQLGSSVAFSQNSVDPAGKLTYAWSFGDGGSSLEANPSHSFIKGGTYNVTLTVKNEAGATVSASLSVVVADVALVSGLLCSRADESGWCWQRPLPQADAVSDFQFIDVNTAYAVGDFGTALKTTNAGKTWMRLNTGTDVALQRVKFIDSQIGVIVGNNGLLLRTTDAGATWTSQQLPSMPTAFTVRSLGGNTLWIGDGGYLATSLISLDAGANWQPYGAADAASTCGASPMYATSTSEAWCLGWSYYGASQRVNHSTDAGAHWVALTLPALDAYVYQSTLGADFVGGGFAAVLTYESGYADSSYVQRRRLYRTADAGANWQITELAIDSYYSAVSFADPQHGLLSCAATYAYDSACQNLKTEDGGATWVPVASPELASDEYLTYTLRQNGPSLLVAQNKDGAVKLSADAGTTWAEFKAAGTEPTLTNVWFFDRLEGLALTVSGTIRRTSDGGNNWTDRSLPVSGPLSMLKFTPDGTVGWMVGSAGQLYRSNDRGATWVLPLGQFTAVDQPYNIGDVHFIDANNGWLVATGSSSASSNLYRSTDGGSSWTATAGIKQILRSVHFGDANHGVAVGESGQAWVTQDGGATWTQRPTGTGASLVRVRFFDAATVVAMSDNGSIIRSVDGGQTWSRAVSATQGGLNDMQVLDAQTGYAVGSQGTVLKSADAGKTWLPLVTPTARTLNSVFFIDAETGWVAGESGALLVTVFGGD